MTSLVARTTIDRHDACSLYRAPGSDLARVTLADPEGNGSCVLRGPADGGVPVAAQP